MCIRDRRITGCADLDQIEVAGDLSPYKTKYPCHLYPSFPPDVKVIKGSERCCPEGCQNNTLTTLQFLYLDHGGKGGFTILMGKGFSPEDLGKVSGPLLLAGKCAIEETHAFFKNRSGRDKIYLSPYCNDLASTIKALTRLMKAVSYTHLDVYKRQEILYWQRQYRRDGLHLWQDRQHR